MTTSNLIQQPVAVATVTQITPQSITASIPAIVGPAGTPLFDYTTYGITPMIYGAFLGDGVTPDAATQARIDALVALGVPTQHIYILVIPAGQLIVADMLISTSIPAGTLIGVVSVDGAVVGSYISNCELTLVTGFTDNFDGTAGAAPNATYWDVSTVNGGTVQLDGAGAVVINTTGNANKTAIMVRKANFTPTAQSHKVYFKYGTAGPNNFSVHRVVTNTTQPIANNANCGTDLFVFDIYNGAFRFYYYNASNTIQQLTADAAITINTEYCFIFIADGTGWQVALKNTDQNGTETTDVKALTAKINWSVTKAIPAGQGWWFVGDPNENAYALTGQITKYVES